MSTLGALQHYRLELGEGSANEQKLLMMSSFLIDYPFSARLYAHALEVITHLNGYGLTVILSDGDMVLQPRKLQREAFVAGRRAFVHREQALAVGHHPVCRFDKLQCVHAPAAHFQLRISGRSSPCSSI